ncbi:YgaC family protein [Brenneria uluponensis]|uniref:YgaC family protein n=1 Tax=Brenneria uluponensis TaxID=3057057 RepID=UPI0028ED78CF|nr:YgaC family protein [Brenneria ulupoensis]
MYLRPDEVAQVLEHAGFTRDYVTDKAYGFYKGEYYVYVNREAKMGRTSFILHPDQGPKSLKYAYPAEALRSSPAYVRFPRDPQAVSPAFIGIPHGFTSRVMLNRYLNNMFQ